MDGMWFQSLAAGFAMMIWDYLEFFNSSTSFAPNHARALNTFGENGFFDPKNVLRSVFVPSSTISGLPAITARMARFATVIARVAICTYSTGVRVSLRPLRPLRGNSCKT
jgi:hypothetical protein